MKVGPTVLLLLVIILVIAAILCHVIALSTDYWLRSSSSVKKDFLNIGLFVACFDHYFHPHDNPPREYDGCHSLYSPVFESIRDWLVPGWLVACRIIAIIALILEVLGVLLVVLLILWWTCRWLACGDNKRDCCERCMIYTAPILFILAGMFLMCVVMIFGDNAFRLQCKDFWVGGGDPATNVLAVSWGLEVAACILALLSGGFLIWLVVMKARDDI